MTSLSEQHPNDWIFLSPFFPDGTIVAINLETGKLTATEETDPLMERILFAVDRFLESLGVG